MGSFQCLLVYVEPAADTFAQPWTAEMPSVSPRETAAAPNQHASRDADRIHPHTSSCGRAHAQNKIASSNATTTSPQCQLGLIEADNQLCAPVACYA